jgi:transcriptional regulator with XRE-family HTH domain
MHGKPSSWADSPIFSDAVQLLLLKEKGRMTQTPFFDNPNEMLANCLRIHRRRIGLSQEELGRLLGYRDESAVAKHERFQAIPPFLIALAYEIVFGIPVAELFPGIVQTVAVGVEARLMEFEQQLKLTEVDSIPSALIARKLAWLRDRNDRSTGTLRSV